MVENAYQITLVGAFIPLLGGLFWRRATNQGALVSIFCGIGVWLAVHLAGVFCEIASNVIGFINFFAPSLKITFTFAPAFIKSLINSKLLYIAIEPVTAKSIFLSFKITISS